MNEPRLNHKSAESTERHFKPKNVLTIAEVVVFAETAAIEAYNEVMEGGGVKDDAAAAAAATYRVCLPALTNIGAVQAHLAVLVRGIELGFLSHRETRLLVATARTWLAAHEAAQRARAATGERQPVASVRA